MRVRRTISVSSPSVDVGDEQAGGVRPEVDRGDARHFRGTTPRIDASSALRLRRGRADDGELRKRRLEALHRGRQAFGAGRE